MASACRLSAQPVAARVPRSRVRLSEARVAAGLQCHRRLWWTVHDPDAVELSSDVSGPRTAAHRAWVGPAARTLGPGGVRVAVDPGDGARAVEETQRLLVAGQPTIYAASLCADRVRVTIDILSRREDGWGVTAIRSALQIKAHHIHDVAVQAWVARAHGLDVHLIEVAHLNRAHRHPDVGPLWVPVDVTGPAEAFLLTLGDELAEQHAMLAEPLPHVEPGPHCTTPYACPFARRCWPRRPRHHIGELYRIGQTHVDRLRREGYVTIDELPDPAQEASVRARQVKAVKTHAVVVEAGLAGALDAIEGPVAYLDFEAIAPALPVLAGCGPYATLPVQFSVHRRDTDGSLLHTAWLAGALDELREPLARALLQACEGARTVVAWYASFERHCIWTLADALPSLAAPLRALAERLVDLLPIVRNHVYHREFRGTFTLKRVLPALVPELGYEDLAIRDGTTAALALERLLLRPEEQDEHEETTRQQLLAYCERDTLALVRLHEALEVLALPTLAG